MTRELLHVPKLIIEGVLLIEVYVVVALLGNRGLGIIWINIHSCRTILYLLDRLG